MGKLTLPQLERHLFSAADILRGKMPAHAVCSQDGWDDGDSDAAWV